MRISIIVPIHNEVDHLEKMLDSLLSQTYVPHQIILVNDGSTDGSQEIIATYSKSDPRIHSVQTVQTAEHKPGAKVVSAFYTGFELASDFDLIGKFDGDIILPENYFESLVSLFQAHSRLGMASGHLYILKDGEWSYENIAGKGKVRGPIKLYRKECFESMGGLKPSIGWDTVDDLLARYHGWEVFTDPSLKVKHLKPTGAQYSRKARFKQGEAFRRMRYGFWLSLIASAKLALLKRSLPYFFNCLIGYFKNGPTYIVTKEEGKFIRSHRWTEIKKKLF